MESKIVTSESGTKYVGPIATDLYRAKVVRGALKMHVRTGGAFRLTRAASPARLLKLATEYTGKVYKRGRQAEALADMDAYIAAAEAEIPVEAQ